MTSYWSRKFLRHAIPLLGVLALGCAKGADEKQLQSEIKISETHHLVGIIGSTAFAAFPVTDGEVGPLSGLLETFDDSRYAIRAAGSVLREDSYALAANGAFKLLQARSQQSTLVYTGAYGFEGNTKNLFFTDRITNHVGLYVGLPRVVGTPDMASLAGSWHMLSMQVLFADAAALPSIHEVGRAFAGSVSLAADGSITGQGSESRVPSAQLPVTATLRAFQDGAFKLDADFGGDARRFEGGGTANLIAVVGLDGQGDRASGLCALLRHRSTPIDSSKLAGTYDIGGWTLVLNPSAAGFDATLGSLELTAAGDFDLRLRSNRGDDLSYDGDFSAKDDGSLSFDVTRPNETWLAAVDQDYRTLVMIDNVTASSGAIQMLIAIRRKAP